MENVQFEPLQKLKIYLTGIDIITETAKVLLT
jgi:hypothetical protein